MHVWFFAWQVPHWVRQLATLCSQNDHCTNYLWPSKLWPDSEVDLGDIQWREFRGALPILAAVALIHCLLRSTFGRRKTWPCIVLSSAFVFYVHGSQALFLLAACCGAHCIAKAAGASRWAPVLTWSYGLALMAVKLQGVNVRFAAVLGSMGAFLDRLPSVYPWHQSLSLMTLRLISFNMDYYWALKAAHTQTDGETSQAPPNQTVDAAPSYRMRERRHRPILEYDLANCVAHAFYAPLWLAGPTISFNAFISHLRDRPQATVQGMRLVCYAVRLLLGLAILEVALHAAPVFALGRSKVYKGLLGSEGDVLLAAAYGFILLIVMWLKFLVIWRFARLWALCDGVECEENMQRCICNNFSIIGFWKGWHVSFNRWLIRYLYIPLGGNRWRWANVWVVFGFVAMWHDAELKLLAWGMLNAVFVVIEHFAGSFWQRREFVAFRRDRPESSRWLKAMAGTAYVFVMLFVNLVGYGIGVDGTVAITLAAFFEDLRSGLLTLAAAYFTLLCGVQLMLGLREWGVCKDSAVAHTLKAT
eukprot:TRINITY_DN3589_c0_g1_i1.p1 TRINITY_DN3589_c0_g1~~TRINITY_DN3589_c0_g1_i1.p1  ORF type:complete len:550 (-),score=72.11 TRINITY_DN3589_c0_g1_i1:225-1817(-)